MFQKYRPGEDRPITNENFYASVKKCLLHFILGKGERTQRALGTGFWIPSPCAARQDTLLLWTPAYSTGRLGRWSLSSQSYESSSFQSWSEVTSTKDEQIRHCSPGGYLEVQGQGEALFVLEASQKGWPGPSAISSRSMSGPRQCPRGSSSTGIPGQRESHTASLQGENRDRGWLGMSGAGPPTGPNCPLRRRHLRKQRGPLFMR